MGSLSFGTASVVFAIFPAIATAQQTAYASIPVGQSMAAGYAINPGTLIITQAASNGNRIASPFTPSLSGGITEIGGWFFRQTPSPINATLEVYNADASNLPHDLLGTFSITPQTWSSLSPLPTAAPPMVSGDGSVHLVAGQTYFLAYSESSTPLTTIFWPVPRAVPGGGVMPVDFLFGTPGASGVTWMVSHPPVGTTDPFWNPSAFWVNVTPAPGTALPIAGLGLLRFGRRVRQTHAH